MNQAKATYVRMLAAAATMLVVAGCSSKPKPEAARAPKFDEGEQNRLLVRMALAENEYNGIATERAVYPKDFAEGTATLNALGHRRVDTLAYACRDAQGRVTIIRGDEADDLYSARVETVRREFETAGVNLERIDVVKGDHVEGRGISSGQASLIFNRMLSQMAAQPQGASTATPSGASSSSMTNGNQYAK